MLTPDLLTHVAALARAPHRQDAAAALAAAVGAEALFVLVDDPDAEALLPAAGTPQTLVGGPLWRAFLQRCRTPGTHQGAVAYPDAARRAPATACCAPGVALVFVGPEPDVARIDAICTTLPLLAAALRGEEEVGRLRAQLAVVGDEARHGAALARSLDDARSALQKRTHELEEARGRAESAARAKDEFLAMLGHELRNPLAPIVTALDLMRRKGQASLELDILERQVSHLRRLVDDLLDVSRIARGKVDLRRERLDVADVLARAIEASSPLFEQRQQTLSVALPAQPLPVCGDPDRLAQVFTNLLTNAARYSETRTTVRLTAERAAERVRVSVRDEGIGIEPHLLEAIFGSFVQNKQSGTGAASGGLGLGLAIVENLVTLHHGEVRAHSEGLGHGSTFVVDLPLDETSARAPAPQHPTPETGASDAGASGASEDDARVLIVDDNEDAARLLAHVLTSYGYAVRTAADGPSGLRAAREFEPRVAILDIGMPVMDGYQLGAALQQDHGEALELVALTGFGQPSDVARSKRAGFADHLVKPVDVDALRELLDELMG